MQLTLLKMSSHKPKKVQGLKTPLLPLRNIMTNHLNMSLLQTPKSDEKPALNSTVTDCISNSPLVKTTYCCPHGREPLLKPFLSGTKLVFVNSFVRE